MIKTKRKVVVGVVFQFDVDVDMDVDPLATEVTTRYLIAGNIRESIIQHLPKGWKTNIVAVTVDNDEIKPEELDDV